MKTQAFQPLALMSIEVNSMTKTLDINGKITISIDPDSQEFADRVFATLSALDKQHQNLLNNRPVTNSLAYDIFSETNKDIRRQLDELLNSPVCDALFGKDAVCALSGGAPLWFNLMEGIVSQLSIPPTNSAKKIMESYAANRR